MSASDKFAAAGNTIGFLGCLGGGWLGWVKNIDPLTIASVIAMILGGFINVLFRILSECRKERQRLDDNAEKKRQFDAELKQKKDEADRNREFEIQMKDRDLQIFQDKLELEEKRRETSEKEAEELRKYLFNIKQYLDFEREKKERQNVPK